MTTLLVLVLLNILRCPVRGGAGYLCCALSTSGAQVWAGSARCGHHVCEPCLGRISQQPQHKPVFDQNWDPTMSAQLSAHTRALKRDLRSGADSTTANNWVAEPFADIRILVWRGAAWLEPAEAVLAAARPRFQFYTHRLVACDVGLTSQLASVRSRSGIHAFENQLKIDDVWLWTADRTAWEHHSPSLTHSHHFT